MIGDGDRLHETAGYAVAVLDFTRDDPVTVKDEAGKEQEFGFRFAARAQAMWFLACYLSREAAPIAAAMELQNQARQGEQR